MSRQLFAGRLEVKVRVEQKGGAGGAEGGGKGGGKGGKGIKSGRPKPRSHPGAGAEEDPIVDLCEDQEVVARRGLAGLALSCWGLQCTHKHDAGAWTLYWGEVRRLKSATTDTLCGSASLAPAAPSLLPPLQESDRTKVVRQALQQFNAALREHRKLKKNPLSGTVVDAVGPGREPWGAGEAAALPASNCC